MKKYLTQSYINVKPEINLSNYHYCYTNEFETTDIITLHRNINDPAGSQSRKRMKNSMRKNAEISFSFFIA